MQILFSFIVDKNLDFSNFANNKISLNQKLLYGKLQPNSYNKFCISAHPWR